MPLYEYRCDSCGQTIEVLQKFDDEPLTVCQTCSGRLQRLLSPPGLQFKGSGWYITDYARAGVSGKDGKAETADKTPEAKKPDAKPEKTAAKAETKTG